MHDPSTQAFVIRYPWPHRWQRDESDIRRGHRYHDPFITIWHEDPETDGTDDSCGWFMRERHGDPEVLAKIVKRFEFDWDRVFVSEQDEKMYPVGLFKPNGAPRLSPQGIVLDLFFSAAIEALGGRERAARFMQHNLFELLRFAENTVDSLYDSIVQTFGPARDRKQRIEQFAAIVYGCILRETRPWYRHPRWHVWHWRLQVHPWRHLRRFLLTRCSVCGRGFAYGECPTSDSWDSPRPGFLRGEQGLRHSDCAVQAKMVATKQ